MFKVEGIVLVTETNVPVPNLQVVLYDLDVEQGQAGIKKYLEELIGAEEQPGSLFWRAIPGDRIGSKRTDSEGVFEFEFPKEDFGLQEQEARPDLLLLVLAPEDTSKDEDSLRPQPPRERIIHYSFEPVIDAGRRESYVIRLAQKRLEKLGVAVALPPSPPTSPDPVSVESVEESLKESAAFREGINTAATKRIGERLKLSASREKKAREVFQDFSLSRVPEGVRSQVTYLNPGDDLGEQQDQLVTEALVNIPAMDDAAGVARTLRLSLPQSSVQDLGLTVDDDGEVQGRVQVKALLRQVSSGTNSATLERVSPIASNCRASLEAERRFRDALDQCGKEPQRDDDGSIASNGDGSADPVAFTTEVFVRDQIERQTREVKAPEEALAYGVDREQETTATIMPPSPADVTAYYDFHDLQIAFDYIWTEAFDKWILWRLKGIYSEVTRIAPGSTVQTDLEEMSTIGDMEGLYESVRALQTAISDFDEEQLAFVKSQVPDVTPEDWLEMQASERDELTTIAESLKGWKTLIRDAENSIRHLTDERITAGPRQVIRNAEANVATNREKAELLLDAVRARREVSGNKKSRLQELMHEIDERLRGPHKFDIFAPGSVNYGIMLTYRQAWTPKHYQVGDLVSTIPLAPKEVRRYSKKRVAKKSRAAKELEDAQRSRRTESSSTSRADAEIVKRASNKTSFQATAEGSLSLGAFGGRFGTRFGIDAEKASANTKKNFREAVSKAAEEYKQQHRLEVETSTSEELEYTDSGEVSNPNDEITVTYLFYELQRQYEVREQIHKLRPVVLVANEVPTPDEIDEDWLIAHQWILRRVLLDDSYLPALDYVATSFAGDEMALEVMWKNLQRQAGLVDEAAEHLKKKSKLAENAFTELKRVTGLITDPDHAEKFGNMNLAAAFGPFALVGLLGDDNDAAEKRDEVAKLAIERADKDEKMASAKLSREVVALQEAIDKYTTALREHLDRQTAVAVLRIHVKENILCYMHAIWDYECADQRYFRLYNIEVPWIDIENGEIEVTGVRGHGNQTLPKEGRIHLSGVLPLENAKITYKKLSEVADLDNLLGYKGNYMIFPVDEPNHLHWYMMQDYVDPETGGLRDPDEFANYTTEELIDHACCLKEMGVDESDDRIERILELVKSRAASPREESDLIVVPTDSLYIEALPGKHPILEDFKIVHRAIDVKKVQAEVRNQELENVRLAARLLESEREDPDIEKLIRIEGDSGDVIVPPEA